MIVLYYNYSRIISSNCGAGLSNPSSLPSPMYHIIPRDYMRTTPYTDELKNNRTKSFCVVYDAKNF